MTITRIFWWGVLALCLIVAFSPARSAEQSECFSLQELKRSFEVVVPRARQTEMAEAETKAYLAEYNSIGRRTHQTADTLLLVQVPNAPVFVLLLIDGTSCKRMVVHPRLHQHIMAKIARGAI